MIGAAVWAGARSPNQEMASSGRSFRVAFGTGRREVRRGSPGAEGASEKDVVQGKGADEETLNEHQRNGQNAGGILQGWGLSGQAASVRRNAWGHQRTFPSSWPRRTRNSIRAFSPASLAPGSELK